MGVKKIAEFFGLSLTEEELQDVVDRSSFQAMKDNSEKTHGAFGNVLFRKGDYLKSSRDTRINLPVVLANHSQILFLGLMLEFIIICMSVAASTHAISMAV